MILPFILHHANRSCKMPEFYAIKDRLLKHAEGIRYDVQHIEGKKCYSCRGTGNHLWYDNYGFQDSEPCWHCHNGWYKRPTWILLVRKKFGKYIFHKPIDRQYVEENPYKLPIGMKVEIIEGYIDHQYSRYAYLAVLTLFLLYDRKAFKKYFHEMGMYWRYKWYYPMNWLYVVAHFVRYGTNAFPFRKSFPF